MISLMVKNDIVLRAICGSLPKLAEKHNINKQCVKNVLPHILAWSRNKAIPTGLYIQLQFLTL